MPFGEASSATAPRSMLSNKYRMPFHRSLFTIIWNNSRSKSLGYKILGMFTNCCQSLFCNIFLIPYRKIKSATKVRL